MSKERKKAAPKAWRCGYRSLSAVSFTALGQKERSKIYTVILYSFLINERGKKKNVEKEKDNCT